MYQKFLTARSPVRLLEKGLHGGLGKGNLGLVLAGHGIGKTSFLVGVALDELLRGGHVLHVAIDQTVAHTRTHYDTLFEELASHGRLDDAPQVHADVDRRRSIRAVTSASFGAAKLREAVKIQQETAAAPALVILENFDAARASKRRAARHEGAGAGGRRRAVAVGGLSRREGGRPAGRAGLGARRVRRDPRARARGQDASRCARSRTTRARIPSALRVALDPRTLLLTRS